MPRRSGVGAPSPLLHLDPETLDDTSHLSDRTPGSAGFVPPRTPGGSLMTKEAAAKWAAAAAAAAVMGLSMDMISNLSGDAAQRRDARALLTSSGPLLHPLHQKQRGPPAFPKHAPDFTQPPDGTPLTKQTYVTPPNQLILASYPNGRPGALRALQRAPSATYVQDDATTDAATGGAGVATGAATDVASGRRRARALPKLIVHAHLAADFFRADVFFGADDRGAEFERGRRSLVRRGFEVGVRVRRHHDGVRRHYDDYDSAPTTTQRLLRRSDARCSDYYDVATTTSRV